MDPQSIPGSLRDYRCFLDLFARPLPRDSRPLDRSWGGWFSPADGRVVDSQVFEAEGALWIKGAPYGMAELLPGADLARYRGYQCTQIYLSPRDYHRYHAPCSMVVESAWTQKGDLLPVDPELVRPNHRVLIQNRRVILHCRDSQNRPFALLFVGAMNVGRMCFRFDSGLGLPPLVPGSRSFQPQPQLHAGEELGHFELGSTVVVVAPPDLKLALADDLLCQARNPFLQSTLPPSL